MQRLNTAIAAAVMLAAAATATNINSHQPQEVVRDLYENDGGWSSSYVWAGSSSGKSGKSGNSGSSGSWSGSSSHDSWATTSEGWYSGSGKSGKSGSSGSWSSSSSSWASSSGSSSGKSGKSGSGGGGWWGNSSSKSGKSKSSKGGSKSSKGGGGWSSSSSSWSSSGKSGKSGSDGGGSWSSSGKSGKSGSGGGSWSSSGKSGKSGEGSSSWGSSSNSWSSSGKSGKSGGGSSWSSSDKSGKSDGGWYGWDDSKSGKSKSGKSKSGKSSKSSKGGHWSWVPPPTSPPKPAPAPEPIPTKKPTRKPTKKPVPDPTKKPTKKPVAAPKPAPVPKPSLNTICFVKGERVSCSGSPSGDGIVSSFVYTVETTPGFDVDEVLIPIENAILEDVASTVGSDFTGAISAAPADEIDGGKECSHGDDAECSYVNGKMTFYYDDDGGSGHGSSYVVAGSSGSGGGGKDTGSSGSGGGKGTGSSGNGDGKGSGSSQSGSYSTASANQAVSSNSGSGNDACEGAGLIYLSMKDNDYSDIEGVEEVEFKQKTSCPAIVASKAAVVDEGDNLGVLVGIPLLAAILVALALLLARKMRDDREEISLTSPLDDFMGPPEDPYASTIDVHKCTSMYCNCNKGLENVSFIPVPRKVDMNQTRAVAGLPAVTAPVDEDDWILKTQLRDDSDTVTGVHNGSINEQIPTPETSVPMLAAAAAASDSDDSRSYLPVEQRPLRTVSEIPHDSEIDTELESLEGGDDASSIPPPPPQLTGQSGDEMSI